MDKGETMITLNIGTVPGLSVAEQQKLIELQNVFAYHQDKNDTKDKYYEGHIELSDVNLGIALPQGLNKLKVGCNWGQKAVDVLAARSMFDGFVGTAGSLDGLSKLVQDNRLIAEYGKACRDELKFGCVFATLSADADIGCKIRFHSPATAAALWNGEKGRIDCGLAIIDTIPDEEYSNITKGYVIRTIPEYGETLQEGDSVTLVVSKGEQPKPVTVLSFIGIDIEIVRQQVTQTGLVVGEVTQCASDEPYGTVIDQSINAETKVDAGTTINFVISEGPAMPDYGDDATTSGGEPQP